MWWYCLGTACTGAQLGIIFDTDVDRSAVVDGDGSAINSNKFIALMAAIVLQVGCHSLCVGSSCIRREQSVEKEECYYHVLCIDLHICCSAVDAEHSGVGCRGILAALL